MSANYRVRIEYDPDPQHALHDPEGNPLPGPREVYEANPITPNGGPALTYEEYCQYYGNPDRHVVLFVTLEKQCACCQAWHAVQSIGSVDVMDDSPEALYHADTVLPLKDDWRLEKNLGYLTDLIDALLDDVEANR